MGALPNLKFPNNREIPAIFYVSADSSESLQNVHVENDLVVVQRVAREMVLRLGSQVVGLYNEAYDPDGVGPKNGVTIDGIKRTVKGIPMKLNDRDDKQLGKDKEQPDADDLSKEYDGDRGCLL